MNSFVKASQAISSEIQLDKLLSNLMQVVIENAGASKAVLIMPKSGNWIIEAISFAANTITKVLQSIPIEESQDIPVNLINYVSRTQEYIIFNDAVAEMNNFNDPYIFGQLMHWMNQMLDAVFMKSRLIAI